MFKKTTLFLLLFLLTSSLQSQKNSVIDSLSAALKKAKTDTAYIRVLNELAYEYVNDSPETAIKKATEALAFSEKINYDNGKMNANNNIGLAAYYSNDYTTALRHYELAKKLAIKINNHSKLAATINNIGLICDDKAEYEKALEHYLQALKIVEENNGSKYLMASALNNIAIIYKNQEKFKQSLDFHFKALKIKEEINNVKGMGSSFHNIGLVYKQMGELDKSLEYYNKALELRKSVNDLSGTALTLNNIGSVYETKEEYEKAFVYFQESLKIREKQKDKYSLAITLFSLGSNFCSRNKYAEGLAYIEKATAISKELNAKELLKYAYETYADIYSRQGSYQKAFEYQTLLINIKDSILNSEKSQQINELQTKYETENKEKEIALMTKEREIQELELNKNKLFVTVLIIATCLILVLSGLIFNRYKLKQKANRLLEIQNAEISQQKKEITDSINYAKRIQQSILPPDEHWKDLLPNSFIFYRPKDIVSGDFYWIEKNQNHVCFAAVDCTGHGVPGALMSVIGFNLLTQAVNEAKLTQPSEILKHLDAGVTKTLRQSEDGKGVKDGMDLSLCCLNKDTNELQFAGAFNSLYYVRNGELFEIKADKFPIGVNLDGVVDEFTNHAIQLQKNDCVFLFSDGYADQFGGPKGKKFKYKQLKSLLLNISEKSIAEQKQIIEYAFDSWKNDLEQVDDVLIIGVKI